MGSVRGADRLQLIVLLSSRQTYRATVPTRQRGQHLQAGEEMGLDGVRILQVTHTAESTSCGAPGQLACCSLRQQSS